LGQDPPTFSFFLFWTSYSEEEPKSRKKQASYHIAKKQAFRHIAKKNRLPTIFAQKFVKSTFCYRSSLNRSDSKNEVSPCIKHDAKSLKIQLCMIGSW
jgi:hypothetical protein